MTPLQWFSHLQPKTPQVDVSDRVGSTGKEEAALGCLAENLAKLQQVLADQD